MVENVSIDRIRLLVLLSWVNEVKNVCWFFGVCLLVSSIVLFYLLFMVMFCNICNVISVIGVIYLVCV